jgi:predicted nuclease of restriction endonuclease-like (RecB) superfamily
MSQNISSAAWGDSFVEQLADYIKNSYPQIKGFNKRGLYRMKQFYETYRENEFVSALLTQISWTNHLTILSKTKSIEEKEFYIDLCIKEHYSTRELERQINSSYFERYMLSTKKISPIIHEFNQKTDNAFLDTYVLEFLNLPERVTENDLQKAIIRNLKNFIL